jgi:hypothetical protein
LILGVNSFESDNDLDIEAFSCDAGGEQAFPCPFSISVLEVFGLHPAFGNRFFRDDLPRGRTEEEVGVGPGELEVKAKLTLLGVGLGVGGILITTESSGERPAALEGICKERFFRLHC